MSQTIRRALRSVHVSGGPIRVARRGLDGTSPPLEGLVVGLSPSFVLLQRIDPAILLDGYVLLRVGDITSVDAVFPACQFVRRALKLRGLRRRLPRAAFPLNDIIAVLAAAQSLFPLVTFHQERRDRNVCWVGQVQSFTPAGVVLRELTPSATWDRAIRYRIASLTRVDFGGSYEAALALVAKVRPHTILQQTAAARPLVGKSRPRPNIG